MTETFTRAKDDDDLNPEADDAEAQREGEVWGKLCRSQGINADMVVSTAHTATEYVWVIDRSLAESEEE